MKSTKFWVILLAGVLVLSAAAALFLMRPVRDGVIAGVYQNGIRLHSIDLSAVESPYTITVTGSIENIIEVEKGRIRVRSATCPDQVCVHQGWISSGIVPIACLPNGLIIQIEAAPDEPYDAVAH